VEASAVSQSPSRLLDAIDFEVEAEPVNGFETEVLRD
jgi:hypothetical protein